MWIAGSTYLLRILSNDASVISFTIVYIFPNSIVADVADKFPKNMVRIFGSELRGPDKQLISAATALPKYFNVIAESCS